MSRSLFSLPGSRKSSFLGSTAGHQAAQVLSAPLTKPRSERKEPAYRVLTLVFAMVLSLHLGCAWWFADPGRETVPTAKPLEMQVSLVKVTKPKPTAPPPARAKQQPSPAKKPQIKPKLITPEIVDTQSEFAPTAQAFIQGPALDNSNRVEPKMASQIDTPLTPEPDDSARYAHNPAPRYPSIALSRGWQGKVLLRVLVSAAGDSETVTVEQSSGYEILDESALDAVKNWQFTPARQGDAPLASTVIVPIIFSLRDE